MRRERDGAHVFTWGRIERLATLLQMGGRQPWVLVVDDDRDHLDAVIEVLDDAGFAVRGVTSASEAMVVLDEDHQPCVVLSDMIMPDVSGLDLLNYMKESPHLDGVAVLLLTALSPGADLVDLGVPVLHEPYQADDLLAFVRRHFPAARATDVPG